MITSDENRLEEYKTNFLNCVVTYNSRRENPAGQTDLTQEMSSHSGAISDELVDQETGLQLEPEPEPSSDTVLVLDTGLDMEPLSEPEELQEEDEQDKAQTLRRSLAEEQSKEFLVEDEALKKYLQAHSKEFFDCLTTEEKKHQSTFQDFDAVVNLWEYTIKDIMREDKSVSLPIVK